MSAKYEAGSNAPVTLEASSGSVGPSKALVVVVGLVWVVLVGDNDMFGHRQEGRKHLHVIHGVIIMGI